jgi:hypothetical protein
MTTLKKAFISIAVLFIAAQTTSLLSLAGIVLAS